MFETVIIWRDGEKAVYKTSSKEEAEMIIQRHIVAFGNQIAYTYTKEIRVFN